MQALYCGIDIGTSSAKAMVYNEDLLGIFNVAKEYDFVETQQNRAELDPEEVCGAVFECLQACRRQAAAVGTPLRFIAFSSALHSFIAVDADDRPVTNCITWADMRAAEFNSLLGDSCEGMIYQKTGCPGNAIYMPAKILWVRKYRPKIFDAASRFVTIKEYVFWKLSGEWLVDYGIASGGGLLNLKELGWDNDLMQMLGIAPTQLSALVDGPTAVRMKRRVAESLGADIPLVVGSGDGPLANLGAGVFGSGQFVATIGSSGAIRVFAEKPILDSKQRTWCYRLDGQTCLAGAAINTGGIVLKWLIENYCQQELSLAKQRKISVYEIVNKYAHEVPAGSNGLIFLPFITGERSPDWNSMARGLVIGWGISHSKKELIKAAMEGVVMRLYTNFLILQDMVGRTEQIVVNGGFTRSQVWLRIMAEVFGKSLLLYENTTDSTLGAVLMGLKAHNIIDTYDQVDLKLRLKATIRPDARQVARYREIHRLFETVYSRNKDFFEELQKLRESSVGKSSNNTEVIL